MLSPRSAKRYVSLTTGMAMAVACGVIGDSQLQEAWDEDNDPSWFGTPTRVFDALPGEAKTKRVPWSDTYWSSKNGGIARRWRSSGPSAWDYSLNSQEQLRTLSNEQIAQLSPAEKYDIFRGRYDYPLTKSERSRTSPDNPGWWGMCHGRSSAAFVHAQPDAITVKNPDGIAVPFAASDIKALLTLMHAQHAPSISSFNYVGIRCNTNLDESPGDANLPRCRDINAGSFHLILGNEIGINGRAFVMDRTRGAEVWNNPVFGYKARVKGEQPPQSGAAPGTVRELIMETTVLSSDGANPAWNSNKAIIREDVYRYTLELNSANEIVGGEWISWERPDFFWRPNERQPLAYFTGDFAKVKELLTDLTPEPSATPGPRPTPVPTPAPTPTATPLDESEEVLKAGNDTSGFTVSLRTQRTYRSSEWIHFRGTSKRPMQAAEVRVLTATGEQVARALTHITRGDFHAMFHLPEGVHNLTIRTVSRDGSQIFAETQVKVTVLHH